MFNGEVVGAIRSLTGFGAADDLGRNAEGLAFGDDACCGLWLAVQLHAMPHIVDAEHFLVSGATGLLDGSKNRRNGQEIVFDNVHRCAKAQAFGLPSSGAVDHAVDGIAIFLEELLYNGRVGTSRAH